MFFTKRTPTDLIISQIKPQIDAFQGACAYGIDIEIKVHKQKRSSQANNFYWMNLADIATVLNEAGCTYGEYELPYSTEILHDINKKLFGVPTTTKLDVHAFSEYMNKIFSFWIEKTAGAFEPKEAPYSYFERTGFLRSAA